MTRAVFQSGISWRVVEAKWPGFREAFDGFDPETVAGYAGADVERLAADARIIRNRRKIEATLTNAERLLEFERGPGGFAGWLRSHRDLEATVAALRAESRYLDETGAYYLLYVVGEPVPPLEEWAKTHDLGRARRGRTT